MRHCCDDDSDGFYTKRDNERSLTPPTLKVGSVYVQAPGTWHEKHFVILSTDGNVAFARCIYNKISDEFVGDCDLFNVADGWPYNNPSDLYRLVEKV